MRFKTHLEIKEAVEEDRYNEYIEESSLRTRLEIIDSKEGVYPLSKSPELDRVKKMGEKYNLYTNILNMNLGQFILLESQLKSENTRDDIVAALIIRPKTEKDYSNDNPEEEERILNEILEEDVRDINSIISSMMYKIVRQLAQEDIRRFNEIYEIKMSVAMVELSFLSQKLILDNARARAEESRQRASIRR